MECLGMQIRPILGRPGKMGMNFQCRDPLDRRSNPGEMCTERRQIQNLQGLVERKMNRVLQRLFLLQRQGFNNLEYFSIKSIGKTVNRISGYLPFEHKLFVIE